MRLFRLRGPSGRCARLKRVERGGEGDRRRVDRQARLIETAEFLGRCMDMNEIGARAGDFEESEALGGNFAEAAAKQDRQIRLFDFCDQLGVRADAEIAGIARMQRIEQRAAPVARRHRQFKPLRETLHGLDSRLAPSRAADDQYRLAGLRQ
jgi:hypothetical protein